MTSQPREKNGRYAAKAGGPSRPRRKKVQAQAPVQVQAVPERVKKIYAALVLDNSGSMASIAPDARRAFQELLKSFKEGAQQVETRLAVVTFGSGARVVSHPDHPKFATGLEYYYPNEGSTALWDGVGLAMDTLQGVGYGSTDDVSYLVMVVTDGQENSSVRWNARTLNDRMGAAQRGPWTFAFQVPRGQSRILTQMGVPAGNVREWEQTSAGTREMGQSSSIGTQTYYSAVTASAAPVQVDSFFVQTDLSKVTSRQLNQLVNLSGSFKAYETKVEAAVKDFVEAKTKRPYVVGQAYYQLMKAEKVQPQKAVVIVSKDNGKIYGGQEARDLIGLPKGANAKVVPGNHAAFDIFVQSTSVNRKLPRGTKVLVDVTQTVGLAPTWDHTAVASS